MKAIKKSEKIIAIVLVVFFFLSGFLSVYFSYFHHYSGNRYMYLWAKNDNFNMYGIAKVYKKENETLTILNFADIQLSDIEDIAYRSIIHQELTELFQRTNPDLITLTGDQTWSNENLMSLKSIIRWLEGYKVPYAPVFGNHDGGNEEEKVVSSKAYSSDLYTKAKNCLFTRGPSNIGGMGNYCIAVMEGDHIFKVLYMIDNAYSNEISNEQMAWMKWCAEGFRKENGGEYVEGLVFMHEPIPEYEEAYYAYTNGNPNVQAQGPVIVENALWGVEQTGFFDFCKTISVTDIICGHQHNNSFTLSYEGIRLTFATKTGELSFYYEDEDIYLNGGTMIVLDADTTTITPILVSKENYHLE